MPFAGEIDALLGKGAADDRAAIARRIAGLSRAAGGRARTGAGDRSACDRGRMRRALIEGAVAGGVTAYLGMPFAAPPVGDLRWRPPQPVAHWEGVRQATAFAPACLQTGVSMPGEAPPRTSEDCLYLNVWAPCSCAGSSCRSSCGSMAAAGPMARPRCRSIPARRLAKRGVVFVSIAYRLGPLGFLAHPELSAEAGERRRAITG